jgi:tetratricopeptide (TPR) repeat protein
MGKFQGLSKLLFVVLGLSLTACTTFFEVKSEPLQADVFVLNEKNEKKPLGKTPLQMPDSEVKKVLGEGVSAGELFTVVVEKDGFIPQTFNIPATRFGTMVTSLNVKLKEGEAPQEVRIAKEILDHMFLAQKLALAQQFERAQIELDKIITPFPKFSRALSMRASVYYAQKNYPESMKWYEEALKYDPQMEEAVKMLAKVRVLQGLPPAVPTTKVK